MAARVSGIWRTGLTRCGFSNNKAKEYFPQLCEYNDTYGYDTTLADLDKWHTYEGNYTCNFGTIKHYFDQAMTTTKN